MPLPRLRTVVLAAVLVLTVAACGATAASTCDQDLPGVRSGLCLTDREDRVAGPTDRVEVLGDDAQQLGIPDFAGRVLVVNFWASWCGPCRAEQPDLNAATEQLPDDRVAFLGVNIQEPGPAVANALGHEREFSIPYPSLYDPTNAYTAKFKGVGPRSIPSTIIVDPQGRIAAQVIGQTTTQEVVTLVGQLLEQQRQ